MEYPILVLGGYGNFGKRISIALAGDRRIRLVIAGRSRDKARELSDRLNAQFQCESACARLDIGDPALSDRIRETGCRLAIHTSGPFQGQDYNVARACIAAGVNYIDIADDRRFVAGVGILAEEATRQGVFAISGASSVPGLSSAVVNEHRQQFRQLESIDLGIAPGNRAERGRATVAAILSYTGRPFSRWESGRWRTVYGWQDLRLHEFPAPIGRRWLANCDIPDLDLFPRYYPEVNTVVFRAGLELSFLHLGLWALSWFTRWRAIGNWVRYADAITTMSRWFEFLGTDVGGMYVTMRGKREDGSPLVITWNLVARDGHGPEIPSIASVVLAKKIVSGTLGITGATPCMGLFDLKEFMAELKSWHIYDMVRTYA